MRLAITPALITIARSSNGRLLSKLGSVGGISLSGSSSGNPTKPPSGNARKEYSVCLPWYFNKIGPKPIENLLAYIPCNLAAEKCPSSCTKINSAKTPIAASVDIFSLIANLYLLILVADCSGWGVRVFESAGTRSGGGQSIATYKFDQS